MSPPARVWSASRCHSAILRAVEPEPHSSPKPLRLELAGPAPCLRSAGAAPVPLQTADALLLAWLAIEGPTQRDRLAALLWPTSSAEAARNALRQRLFRLRKQAGSDLVGGSQVLALADGLTHDLAGSQTLLGDLHPADDGELDQWLGSQRAQRGAAARRGVEHQIEACETEGDYAAALPLAQALIDADPHSEDAHRRLMRLHYLRGDKAAAMLAFDRCEEVLKHEVGTQPSQETLALLATIESAGALDGAAPDVESGGTRERRSGSAAVKTSAGTDINSADTGDIDSASAPPPRRRRGAVPAAVLRPPRLIGRDSELAALHRGLAAGDIVVLTGEAGMGKSRLLQALAAQRSGLLHASGRPGDNLVPYATLARALRQLLDRSPAAADLRLRRALGAVLPELVPELAPELLPEFLPASASERAPAAARSSAASTLPMSMQPLHQPVIDLLGRAAHSGIDVLALDDLHFADDATLELLQSLLAAPRDAAGERDATPLRCCLGLRPAAAGTQLHALIEALASAGPHTRINLQPLTETQVGELVDSLALPGIDGAAVAPLLHQRTGGNPLFTLETLKLAWRDGSIGAVGTTGTSADFSAALPRPQTLAQLIGQQLARLSAAALALARVAAVAGVDFSIPLAESLLGRNALELADAWAELEAQQVLRGDSFAHDLIHDAVLQGLPEVINRHLHGLAAAWLEARAPNLAHGVEPARVAAHWEAAGQRARALPSLRAAAELAHRALREGERIQFLLHAAEIAESAERLDEAFELVRSAIEGHMNTIRQADGLPLLDRLDGLARSPRQRARAAGDRAWYATVLGDLGAAIDLGEAALALATALPGADEALAAPIRQRLGTALGMAGRFAEALPHMQAAQAWIETHANSDDRSEFQGNLAVMLDNLGQPAQAQAHHLRGLASTQAQGDQAHRATLLANYALNRLDAGDVTGATEQAAQAQRIVSTFEMAGASAGFIATLQAQCARVVGRYGEALAWCDRAEMILAERNPARLPVARLHRAQVWLDLGQHARALQILGGAALDAAREMPARYAVRWLVLLARVKRRLRQDASGLLAQAAALSPDAGWPELRLIVQTEQALLLAAPAALASLAEIAQTARGLQLSGAELGAELHAAAIASGHDAALAEHHARAALALAEHAECLHIDRAARWLHPAQALAAAGRIDEARSIAAAGQAWLRTTAAIHMPAEFADSFLHQHPVNGLLMAWRASGD